MTQHDPHDPHTAHDRHTPHEQAGAGHGAQDAHDAHGHSAFADGHEPSTLKGYATGFILSVILTAIPFWLVMGHVVKNPATASLVLLGLAAVQVIVHMIYFLHMNTRSEGGWTMLALLFTAMVLFIMLTGSIWVMFHLNANMMPGMMPSADQQMQDMRTRP